MATRTPRKTAAKKTTAKKTAPARKTTTKKTAPPKPASDKASTAVTLVKKPKLAVRRRLFVGPYGVQEQAAIRAALDAAACRLPVPVRTWNGSTAKLTDGTLLIHNPGPDRHFTAHIACPHGAIHGWPITTHNDLREARAVTRICTTPHGGYNADQAIREGVNPTPPRPATPVLPLDTGIRSTVDTQPLTVDEIRQHIDTQLAARADTETPKEHPTDE